MSVGRGGRDDGAVTEIACHCNVGFVDSEKRKACSDDVDEVRLHSLGWARGQRMICDSSYIGGVCGRSGAGGFCPGGCPTDCGCGLKSGATVFRHPLSLEPLVLHALASVSTLRSAIG